MLDKDDRFYYEFMIKNNSVIEDTYYIDNNRKYRLDW